MQPEPDIDVVIVAFNSGAWLARAVHSALAAAQVSQVIVVDNASRDDSLRSLPEHVRIKVLSNAHNDGFAVAANRGWRAATAPLVVVLNPDCVLAADDLSRLARTLYSQAQVGVMSAQLLNADGSLQRASLRRDPTPFRAIAEAIGWLSQGIHINAPNPAAVLEVEACSGALMMLKKSTLEQSGGFDEGYFLHCEDLDLCRRVRQLGLRVMVDTSVRVIHDKGTSSQSVPRLVAQAKYRGMLRYFEKFDRAQTNVLLCLLVYGGAWLRYQWALLRAGNNR